MRKIIASIDIGSDSIKLVVGEFIESRLEILSASKIQTNGVENAKVINSDALTESIKQAIYEASETLGIEIKKVILGVNSLNTKLIKVADAIKINNEEHIVTGDDVSMLIAKCAEDKATEGHALIGVIPVEFTLDDDRISDDPKGLVSENLGIKAIVVTSPKEAVMPYIKAIEDAGCKVIDVIPNTLGDYYTIRNERLDKYVGAVINLGNETSTISIFNKGILTNTKTYKIGGYNIVRDIGFIKKVDDNTAKAIYSDLALATPKLANPKDVRLIRDLDGKEIKINQSEVSEITHARLEELLNLVKMQINILTKKEISYIIIGGGLTELKDFHIILESVFGKSANIGKVNLIGVRDNAYISSVGILKYFNKKIELRGKTFSIFTGSDIEDMNNSGLKASTDNNSLLGKVFGYFFD